MAHSSTWQCVTSRVKLPQQPMGVDLHPSLGILAVGLLNGALQCYKYSSLEQDEDDPMADTSEPSTSQKQPIYFKAEKIASKKAHKDSCRAVCFSQDGLSLFSAAADGSLRVTNPETASKVARILGAHECGISRLTPVDSNLVASGDEEGCVKVWDARQRHCCGEIFEHDDFISDMAYNPNEYGLATTSGDMTIITHDLRKFKPIQTSEHDNPQHEALSVALMEFNATIVCGTQSGRLMLYPWEKIESCDNQMKGHPDSVDVLVKYDEQTLISGCGDGSIRVVRFNPKRIVGSVGSHGKGESIERMALSHDLSLLASIGHDEAVRLWDLSFLKDEKFLKGQMLSEEEKVEDAKKSDVNDNDSDDSDWGDSDSDDNDGRKKGRKKRKLSRKERKRRRKMGDKVPSFFSDLA